MSTMPSLCQPDDFCLKLNKSLVIQIFFQNTQWFHEAQKVSMRLCLYTVLVHSYSSMDLFLMTNFTVRIVVMHMQNTYNLIDSTTA